MAAGGTLTLEVAGIEIVVLNDSDPGIALGPFADVDSLSEGMLAVLVAALIALGVVSTRRGARA